MAGELDIKVDPNVADLDTLRQLPGVGATLAERILNARPFESVSDLSRVEGIGESLLENLRPYVEIDAQKFEAATIQASLAPAIEAPEESALAQDEFIAAEGETEAGPADSEESPAAEVEELGEEEAALVIDEEEAGLPQEVEEAIAALPSEDELQGEEQLEQPEQVVEGSAEATPQLAEAVRQPVREPAYVTQGQALLLAFVSGLFALILGIALSLGIIAGVNQGRLQFASPAQLNALSVQVDGLSAATETLTEDLEGLRGRVGNLEALSGRVGEVEQATEELRAGLDTTAARVEGLGVQVEGLDTQLGELGSQVEALQSESERFSTFLEGLRGLMEQLFGEGGG